MGEKHALKSFGVWGVLAAAVLEAAETEGWIPPGGLATVGQMIALAVALYGRWTAKDTLRILPAS